MRRVAGTPPLTMATVRQEDSDHAGYRKFLVRVELLTHAYVARVAMLLIKLQPSQASPYAASRWPLSSTSRTRCASVCGVNGFCRNSVRRSMSARRKTSSSV